MEKNEAPSDDSADYYGSGITLRKENLPMNDVDLAIENLLIALKQTEEYTEYQNQLGKINMQPDLRKQVDAYRNENFELQNSTPQDELMQKILQ